MDLTPLLCVIRSMERPLLFLIQGPLLAVSVVSTVSMILVISLVSRVDFSALLLLLCRPLATRHKKSSPCFKSLNARVSGYEQIGHHLGLLHGNLLNSLDVTDSVAEGVDDLNVLDILDSVLGVAEMFHVVPKILIMLLPDGL
jgi:hypothetical protein